MKHHVECDTCGKTEVIEVEKDKPTPYEWCYWGDINVNWQKTNKYFYRSRDPEHFDIDDCERIRNPDYDPKVKRKMVEDWQCHDCCKCDKKK